jgi:peroxin-6
LQKYFEVDRCLARGDIFSVRIDWNCNSTVCIPCGQRSQDRSDNIIYFKVIIFYIYKSIDWWQ